MTDRNKGIALLIVAALIGCISIGVFWAVTAYSGVLSPWLGVATLTSDTDVGLGNLYVEYILDASDNMNKPLGDGKKRLDAVKEQLSRSVKVYPPNVNLGLRVYGSRIPYQGREQESCIDIEQVAPVAPGYQVAILSWLRDFQAQGMTPIGLALYKAAKELLREDGKVNTIVLISGGQETCGIDPCQMVEKLRSAGSRITVHVIGLNVDAIASQQLTCIANAGGGVYQNVKSEIELQQVLDQVQQKIVKNEVAAIVPASPTRIYTASTDALVPMITPTLGIGVTQVNPKDGMVMVYVPSGEFLMGSTDEYILLLERECPECFFADEQPQHKIYLDTYWLYQTEVTNNMYAQCVASGVCQELVLKSSYTRSSYYDDVDYADYPVIHVDWDQANVYCSSAGGRLPSEAEWEKAARGTSGRPYYPWGEQALDCSLANYYGKRAGNDFCVGDTNAVGSYPKGASVYGALDMAGNVWEWVMDWYSNNYYSGIPSNNPPGPNNGDVRVVRGGSWDDSDRYLRTSHRNWGSPDYMYDNVGFRCVLSP